GDGTVIFGAHHAAAAMLAGDEPALAVAGVAVGEIGGLAIDADRAGLLLPFDDALVGDVAGQEVAPVAEPDRALRPAQPGGDALHRRQLEPVLLKARIERMDGWVGVVSCRAPAHIMRGVAMGRCI